MTTTTARAELAYLDPTGLALEDNVRADPRLDADFAASVAAHGVLQPLIAVRGDDGHPRVRMGSRRLAAALKAGLAEVPVLVYERGETAAADAAAAEARRIGQQVTENRARASLTVAETAAAVQDLLDLGLTERAITQATRIPKKDIKPLTAVAGSKAAADAAAKHPQLDLDAVAAVAEFDGDDDAVNSLTAAAQEGGGALAHELSRRRQAREAAAELVALTADLTAKGVTIADARPPQVSALYLLAARAEDAVSGNRKEITPAKHKKCPGHSAYIERDWGKHYWRAAYFCADPAKHGHVPLYGSSSLSRGSADPEAAKAERKRVIANNKAWRAAEPVRRAWLAELAQRRTPPDGALRVIIGAIVAHNAPMAGSDYKFAPLACGWLGMGINQEGYGTRSDAQAEVERCLESSSDPRATVITLMLVLGSYEAATHVGSWRNGVEQTASYLQLLSGWGYGLSDIERETVEASARFNTAVEAARAEDEAETAAAAAEDKDAADGLEPGPETGQDAETGPDAG
jgi:ParB family chromosome partitioning protein